MRIGPLTIEQRWARGTPVRHGVLTVVPVARVLEARWTAAGSHGHWVRVTPHHVDVRTLAGERHVRIRPPASWLPLVAALPVLVALTAGRRPRRR